MGFDSTSLFAATAIVLFITAAAFHVAGSRSSGRYWRSWTLANLLLGLAVVIFILEPNMSPGPLGLLPNGLLVVGFSLRWQAAREFGARCAPRQIVWLPTLAFGALCLLPPIGSSFGNVYTLTNALLAALAIAATFEFWRDRQDRLPSRYGLVAAYAIIAGSFALRSIQGMTQGSSFDSYLPQDALLEVHLVVAVLHAVGSGAFALSLAYERGAAELRHAASHDALTGLMNRRAFEAEAEARLVSPGAPFALALLDLDHFKRINDLYGHAVGDAALRACAERCRAQLGPQDVVARIGGEEFAVILDGATRGEAAAAVERMRDAIARESIVAGGRKIEITVSAGLCAAEERPESLDAMMRVADVRLYGAKRGGRNRIVHAAA